MLKKKIELIKGLILASNNRWMSPDLAMYIGDYMEQHPDQKLTRRLERKLEREYYASLRKSKR